MIEVIIGDITEFQGDAIVNAANAALSGGGGVDGAIHRAAGPELLEACRKLGRCPPGEVRITEGFRLPAKYVIHAVGPVWDGGGKHEAELLRLCYRNALTVAYGHGVKSISFPAISCGAYRFPLNEAAKIAVDTIRAILDENDGGIDVTFVCFEKKVKNAFDRANKLQE